MNDTSLEQEVEKYSITSCLKNTLILGTPYGLYREIKKKPFNNSVSNGLWYTAIGILNLETIYVASFICYELSK